MLISTDQSQHVSQPVLHITLSQLRVSQITRNRTCRDHQLEPHCQSTVIFSS